MVVISWRPFFWSERWIFLHRSRVVMHRLLLSSATYYQSLLPHYLPTIIYSTPTTIYQLPTNSTIYRQQIFLRFILVPPKPVWRRFYIKLFLPLFYRCRYMSKQEIWPDIYWCDYEEASSHKNLKLYNYYLTWLCSVLHARYTTFTSYLLADTQETSVPHWSNTRRKLSLQLELRIMNMSCAPKFVLISYSQLYLLLPPPLSIADLIIACLATCVEYVGSVWFLDWGWIDSTTRKEESLDIYLKTFSFFKNIPF